MPADSSIYGRIAPVQQGNRLADMLQIMQAQGLQNQNQLAEYTMRKAQREDEGVNALNAAWGEATGPDGKTDQNRLMQALVQRNQGSRIPAIQETFSKQDKARTDADQAKFKLAKDRHDFYKTTIGALAQEPNLSKDMVLQAGQGLVQQGILTAQMYEQGVASMPDDPVQLRAKLTQGLKAQMTPQQIFQVFAPKPEKFDNGGVITTRDMNPNSPTYGQETGGAAIVKTATPGEEMTDKRTREEGAANRGVTMRGQNLTDARSRETTAATITKPFEVTGEDGKPVLVQQDKQGNIRPVEGYLPKQGASKPLTEGQAKAALFGSRMQAAEDILTALADKGVTTSIPGSRTGYGVGAAVNALQPGERQQLDQAKRDFINAVLRRESGAVISPQEFDNAELQYFPQAGETPAQKAQKKANRELATRGILAEVPDSDNRVAKIRGKSTAANIDELVNKYSK